MIERCGYCGTVHDVGDGVFSFAGATIKTCSMVDRDKLIRLNFHFFGDGDGNAPIYESVGIGPLQTAIDSHHSEKG